MPIPDGFVFPSPFLLPGEPGAFGALVLDSTSPWSDPDGFWSTYNAALASMFDPIYDLVADTGDPSQTVVAMLSAEIVSGVSVTTLDVASVSQFLQGGTNIILTTDEGQQYFEVSVPANVGDTVIVVQEVTALFDFTIGTNVELAYFPGWSLLLDPNVCPDALLPFLAQFNGTAIVEGLDPNVTRAKILGESGLSRGTLSSIVSAVTRNLTFTHSVTIRERTEHDGTPNPYWFLVIVRPEELARPAQLTADVNAVKPGGVQWTLIQTNSWLILDMEASEITLTALEADFHTVAGLEQDLPGT